MTRCVFGLTILAVAICMIVTPVHAVPGEEREPEERVALMRGLADAQQVAGVYLLLDETTREGAHRVASALTDGRSPPYLAVEAAFAEEELERGLQFAIVSSLHRFRPVGDELVASATAEYRTSPGQRYVESYSLALASSIRLAALRVLDRLD